MEKACVGQVTDRKGVIGLIKSTTVPPSNFFSGRIAIDAIIIKLTIVSFIYL